MKDLYYKITSSNCHYWCTWNNVAKLAIVTSPTKALSNGAVHYVCALYHYVCAQKPLRLRSGKYYVCAQPVQVELQVYTG